MSKHYDDDEIKVIDKNLSIAIMKNNYRIVKRCLTIAVFFILCLSWFLIKTISAEQQTNTGFDTDSMFKENIYSMYDLNKPFTTEKLISTVKDLNIQNPKIVIAQAILESANFKSQLFILNHNLFGMKKSFQRPSTHTENNAKENYIKSYAFYSSWQNSVIDYAIWQTGYARNLSEEQYFNKLAKSYAEDTLYINKLKRIIKDNEMLMSSFDK